MAIIVSERSGNWEDGTTWVGGVVPTATDDVTVATDHEVIISTNLNHFTNPVRVKGVLTIAEGGSLTIGEVFSPYNYGVLEIYGGSEVKSTGNGLLALHAGAIKSVSTSASERAKFSCHMGETPLKVEQYKTTKYCTFDVHFVDIFSNQDQTTGMSILFYWRSSAGVGTYDYVSSNFIAYNCTFTNLKGTRNLDGTAVAGKSGIWVGMPGWTSSGKFSVDIQNCDFRSVDGGRIAAATTDMLGVKDWMLKKCTFENTKEVSTNKILLLSAGTTETSAKLVVENVAWRDVTLQDTGVAGSWGNISNAQMLVEYNNSLDIVTQGGGSSYYSTNENCIVRNGFSFYTETTENPHIIGIDNLDGYITETTKADEPNHIMSSNNVQNCLSLGNGDMYNYVGTYSDKSVVFKNNTFVNNIGDNLFSMLLVENSTFLNVSTEVKNNLLYDVNDVEPLSYSFCRWVGGESHTKNIPIDLAYNAMYPQSSKEWLAPEYVNISTELDTNVVVNPQFLDTSRTLRTATSRFLGYEGDISENNVSVPYMLSNGYDDSGDTPTQNTALATGYIHRFGDVVAWVKEGYTPQNMTLATAGEGGTYVGAVMPKEAPSGLKVVFNGVTVARAFFDGQPIALDKIKFLQS